MITGFAIELLKVPEFRPSSIYETSFFTGSRNFTMFKLSTNVDGAPTRLYVSVRKLQEMMRV